METFSETCGLWNVAMEKVIINVSDKTNNNRFLTLGTRERKGN